MNEYIWRDEARMRKNVGIAMWNYYYASLCVIGLIQVYAVSFHFVLFQKYLIIKVCVCQRISPKISHSLCLYRFLCFALCNRYKVTFHINENVKRSTTPISLVCTRTHITIFDIQWWYLLFLSFSGFSLKEEKKTSNRKSNAKNKIGKRFTYGGERIFHFLVLGRSQVKMFTLI